jgi:hypothetical protein
MKLIAGINLSSSLLLDNSSKNKPTLPGALHYPRCRSWIRLRSTYGLSSITSAQTLIYLVYPFHHWNSNHLKGAAVKRAMDSVIIHTSLSTIADYDTFGYALFPGVSSPTPFNLELSN